MGSSDEPLTRYSVLLYFYRILGAVWFELSIGYGVTVRPKMPKRLVLCGGGHD